MGNLEHLEAKYSLPSTGRWQERVERTRFALKSDLDQTDPDAADKLRKYGMTDLVCFIDAVVSADRRKAN
jgi:hypothetical protein